MQTECLTIFLPKEEIDFILSGYPDVDVVGSRMTEEGWELIIEADPIPMSELIWELGNDIAIH